MVVQTSIYEFGKNKMETVALTCNNCGASLEVQESIRFVTCNYCKSRLEIKRSESACFTQVLEEVRDDVHDMAEDLETIRLQNELERIDREWDMEREGYMIHTKHGKVSPESGGGAGAIIGGIIAIVFGIFWISMTSKMGAPGIFPLFGLVFIGIAVVSIASGASKSQTYSSAKQKYQARRRVAERDLQDRYRR